MKVLYERCAGLDVHKTSVVACLRVTQGGEADREVRSFATTTKGLLELSDWLSKGGCTHVAMESTGVYWKPVWHVLDGQFEITLANAARIRNVPGRKSDVSDAVWIADLLAHGLIEGSYVPKVEVQDLRDLTRTRKQLVRETVQHVQRIQRVLEDANVKLASVISDVMGVSGRRILRAIIDGEENPHALAQLGSPRLQSAPKDLMEALRGRVRPHHRFLLRQHFAMVEALEQKTGEFDEEIGRLLEPFRVEVVDLLKTIPGIGDTAARVIIAEVGLDVDAFPDHKHLVSWAGLCPGLNESAGKQKSSRLRKGAPWLKAMLIQCAWGAARTKGTYLQAQYHRIRSRRGPKKAIVAVAATMLTGIWHILRHRVPWLELGHEHFTRDQRAVIAARLANRIRDLGFQVQLQGV